jgi:hypothetical protein
MTFTNALAAVHRVARAFLILLCEDRPILFLLPLLFGFLLGVLCSILLCSKLEQLSGRRCLIRGGTSC